MKKWRSLHAEHFLFSLRKKYNARVLGAILRNLGPAIVALQLPFVAWAGPDLAVGGSYRSYPLSGVAEVETGYGVLLWGALSAPLSGYVRPRLWASSALSYNSLDGALEVFPLAFLGGRVGGESTQNDHVYSAYDCTSHICLGRAYRTYAEAELLLGAGPLFSRWRWRRERWSTPERASGISDFIEPTSGFALSLSGASETVYQVLLGYHLGPQWSVIAGGRYAEDDAHEFSRQSLLSLRWSSAGFNVGVGGGLFESTLKAREWMAVSYLRWEIVPSLALH